MSFQLTDVPRLLPEILLIVLALLVLVSDLLEKWGSSESARRERSRSSGSLTAIGLGLVFGITLLQSGYVYQLPADAPVNFFTNIIRNLQSGGPAGDPILGAFATDHLTMIARLTFVGAALLTCLLTLDSKIWGNPGEFYALILFSTTGMCLMAGADELLMMFLAVELTSIPLYVLAGYFNQEKQSSEAGLKYFLFGALSSAIMLYGMSLVYGHVANALNTGISANNLTQFPVIASTATADSATSLLTLGMLFVIAGVGYKVAVVPFHAWSPDVYQGAPTPITAFISTASKAAGFILLYRLLTTAFPNQTGSVAFDELGGWTSLLAFLALLTVIVGNLAALPQTNAKRLLAWSSVAQAGFLLMALLAFGSPAALDQALGTSSLLYYLIVYTITNIGAFGALTVAGMLVGGDDISHLNGLARRNLGLAALFALCVLSLAGIPPLAGFFAKFYVFMAAWQGGAWLVVIVGVVTTVISLYYYLRLLKAMFFAEAPSPEPVRAPLSISVTLGLSAALLLLLGIFPNAILGIISQVQAVAGR